MRRRHLLGAGAASCALAWVHAASVSPRPLRLGLTAVILADQAAFLARWSNFLSARVGARVEFSARDAYQAIVDPLFANELDAAWICGYAYLRYQARLQLMAVPVYQGLPQYQSYLIRPRTREREMPIVKGWSDLRGKVFAYSDPLSNSGWLVAQGQLAAVGLHPSMFRKAFFAHGHRNVAEAVASRLAHAGSIDGYVWETMRLQGMHAAMNTEVVWKSGFHGFPPLVWPSGRKHPKMDVLQQTLLDMSKDEEGLNLLRALNLDGFVPGAPVLFDSIRKLAQSVSSPGGSA